MSTSAGSISTAHASPTSRLYSEIGSTIAAIIVCVVTLIASGLTPALIMLAVILVYQQAENYLIQPAVMGQVVELSGFATIASVMVGGALLGVVGAVLAVPITASAKVVIRHSTDGRRQRIAALEAAAAASSDSAEAGVSPQPT